MRSVLTAMVVALWALPALAQETGQMIIETGGDSHLFSATGVWADVHGLSAPAMEIEIAAEHADGTDVFLNFVVLDGQPREVLFRLREPDTADVYGREWTEGPGFRVVLSGLRREGAVVTVVGTFRGAIVDPFTSGGRARLRGSFVVDLVEPSYSPS
ncbi:hypothetical protein [Roseicyclus mahoneyensis]|uniref:Uncharacterized protein n=1 Tax=Roseicyclus mahoneyensis TaxID=164332 RepID=A0A316GLH0_9RHOB|nr:hypothetical protein [Roseicyclus mahoneyensis]PWK61058.1 hypothetical protein C7455_103258 [Roseicyclus mahoneyensis]